MLSWAFLTARPIGQDGDLGGTEQAIRYLSDALAARGHRVGGLPADVSVAVNDANLLPDPLPGLLADRARLPVVWFHNEVGVWREVRKRRLAALWRHRPVAVFVGADQARRASRLFPFRARKILSHGLPNDILTAAPAGAPPGPQAIFISQAYRGLADIIGLWQTRIAPVSPAARLTAYIAPADLPRYRALAAGSESISIRPRVANAAMPGLLRGARLVLAPGHRAETFCLAAAEAVAMGVPVITLGIGALKERVISGRTGFVCRTFEEMAVRTRQMLTDDAVWRHMQYHGLGTRQHADWDHAAMQWEALIDSNIRGLA